MKVKKLADPANLVATKEFKHAKFLHETFNPIQSAIFPVHHEDANFCVAASTSSGKTVIGEMILAHTIRALGGKGMYVAPYRALAQEKVDDWKDPAHHFADLNLSICTGDYSITSERIKELSKADITLFTYEMLSSRARNFRSEKSDFLRASPLTVVLDESHLLTVPGRGDHIEVALMKLSLINPDVRFVLLSATMPNVSEICSWVNKLNGKPVYLLESNYRPCKLNLHFPVHDTGWYNHEEESKVDEAVDLVIRYPQDKFLVFAHTKRTGEMMKTALRERGINAEFHKADLSREQRLAFEQRFREDPNFRVIVATSTLSTGVNLPARRVIILGVKRGPQMVPAYELMQEAGRAGRPRYDKEGDAYLLLPRKDTYRAKVRATTVEPIRSQLLGEINGDYKTLAFHIVSEIHHGNVSTRKDIRQWYSRSLANHQAQDLDTEILENVIELLVGCGAIRETGQTLEVTVIGTIASMFYFSPFDVSDLSRNFSRVFDRGLHADDHALAFAMANLDTHRLNIASNAEKDEMSGFARKLEDMRLECPDGAKKIAFCYYNLIKGEQNHVVQGMMNVLQSDFPRVAQVLQVIDSMATKWGRAEWLERLKTRVLYGVADDRVHLCRLPHIGGVRANRLWEGGVRTFADVVAHPDKVMNLARVTPSTVKEIVEAAKYQELGRNG